MASKIIPDDFHTATSNNDFKSTASGQMINIHGKEYASVAPEVAVLQKKSWSKTLHYDEVVSIDENNVVVKATGSLNGVVVATGHAEENRKAEVGLTHICTRKCGN